MTLNNTGSHDCANCDAYGYFTDKNGNPKNPLIWSHLGGGYYERDSSQDKNDDIKVYPCRNCAGKLPRPFYLYGNPYYGLEYVFTDDMDKPEIHFTTLEKFAEESAYIFVSRKHLFLNSFQIEDWSAKYPPDLSRRIIEIYNSWIID